MIYPQENYVFEHFSIPEGLSNPTVHSILQDSYGFLWVGTPDGLNRYDGYEFKIYKNDPDDPKSLPAGGAMWALAEDHDGNLWIGGQNILVMYDRKNDNFRTYSLGMKQRLSIAAALLNDPEVMILDEPTNGLDPQGIADIRELIRNIAGSGKTIILASHLLDEVQKVCTHFGVLRKGKLLYSGNIGDVA
ncbi:MAG: AAA family ATPase, partial [Bacteroidetes bacterium]|nr:AAA family ATPase [Bacteroidota bacterium]